MYKKFIAVLFLAFSITAELAAQSRQDGLRALDFEKYESARSIFQNLTKSEPESGDNYYYLGQAYTNLFKLDSARLAYAAGMQKDPNNPANYAGTGELLLSEKKIPEAKEQFNKALAFSKNRFGVYTDIRALTLVATSMVSTDNKLL